MFGIGFSYVALLVALYASANARADIIHDFQVAQPPVVPKGAKSCSVKLIERTFASSYGDPETIAYTPPTDCGQPGSWAAITLNLTGSSNGTQYDRLGVFTIKDVEIWRTSTPEPTTDGIVWTYVKDVTRFTPLFASPGNLTFELDNIVETGLNGEYATVVYATFYESSPQNPPAQKADLIIPISTLAGNSDDVITVSPAFSLNVTLPQNTVQIYAEIFASGNGDEEEWYYNVPNEYFDLIPAGFTFGNGSFREVQLLVDGQLAGVVFPYAVQYTGGVNPSLWRPIVSYSAFDEITYFIDLTPFVGILSDGAPHTFTLNVVSAEAGHTIDSNWYVTAALHIVTGTSNKRTTGKITAYDVAPYAVTKTTGHVSGQGSDLEVTITTERTLSVEAEITDGEGVVTQVVWSQALTYSNTLWYLDNATIENVVQKSEGTSKSTHNGSPALSDVFSYPLTINFTYTDTNYTSWNTSIDHSYIRDLTPSPFILGTTISERQTGFAEFVIGTTKEGNHGNGTNADTFSYVDKKGNTYTRTVAAANDKITYDEIGGNLA